MTEKILACPYCGSEEGVLFSYFGEPIVGCGSCNAHGPEANNDNDAILLWNAAANALAAKDAEIEKLRGEGDAIIRVYDQLRTYIDKLKQDVGRLERYSDNLLAENKTLHNMVKNSQGQNAEWMRIIGEVRDELNEARRVERAIRSE